MITLSTVSFFLVLSVAQSLEVQVQNGSFSQRMYFTLNSTIREILIFHPPQNQNPYRIEAWTTAANVDDPILIEVQLEQDSLTWTVPLILQDSNGTSLPYSHTSRILCDNNMLKNDSNSIHNFTVTLSTSSKRNVSLCLQVDEDDLFFVTHEVNYTVNVSQSQPRFFFYKFGYRESRTIIINIDSNNSACLTASIQQNHCPIINLDDDNLHIGIHYTIMSHGGVKIDKRNYPNGFSLVFLANVDDDLCNTRLGPFFNQVPRIGNETVSAVSFTILMGVDENGYILALVMPLCFILIFYLFVFAVICTFNHLEKSNCFPLNDATTEHSRIDNLHQATDDESDSLSELLTEPNQVPPSEEVYENDSATDRIRNASTDQQNSAESVPQIQQHDDFTTAPSTTEDRAPNGNQMVRTVFSGVTGNENLETPANEPKQVPRCEEVGEIVNEPNQVLTCEEVDEDGHSRDSTNHQNSGSRREELEPLIPQQQDGTKTLKDFVKKPEENKKESNRYCKNTIIVAIFYIIPVLQLMITYQNVLNTTGNTDVCYYNFRCANPGPWFTSDLNLSAFNNVYSNIGYFFMGFLFLGVVRYRQYSLPERTTGVLANYGIFYGMGIALIGEGALSACYHICPSRAHFQFDTTFMYVMAILCIVKVYQNRHQDIAPSASSTFIILASIIIFAMVGLLESKDDIVLGSGVGIGYVILCTFLSFKIYYFGSVLKQLRLRNIFYALRPQEKGRFYVLIIVNIINYAMLITVEIFYVKNELNFGTLLLILLMANVILYAFTYTVMKLVYGERINLQAFIYGSFSVVSWCFGVYFYLDTAIEWDVSPAQSRSWNQPCVFLEFYDKHDLWHLFSAAALFLNFMYLLYLDDDISHKRHEDIAVF